MADPADLWRGIHDDVLHREGSIIDEVETWDWMSFQCPIIDGRPLRDRPCDEILRRDSDLDDPDDDRYHKGLLWDNRDRNPLPVSLPQKAMKIIRKEKRRNGLERWQNRSDDWLCKDLPIIIFTLVMNCTNSTKNHQFNKRLKIVT